MALEYAEINQIPITASSIVGTDIFEIEHAGESQQASASVMADYFAINSVITAMVQVMVDSLLPTIALAANPIGSGLEWYAATAPSNYLLQQGQAIYRSTYSALFAVIGTTWGVGDGTNTFNLPDKREVNGVGIGTNATVVMSAHDVFTLAEYKDDRSHNHRHKLMAGSSQLDGWAQVVTGTGSSYGIPNTGADGTNYLVGDPKTDGVSIPRMGNTTRGKSIGVNWIIKYQ